ncbi:hypothetical protein GOODEAATRI_032632 [Goodea atripinnis]|uniref:Uncharacterized protein n=1 Tax=Goodea atripinnis TaxID=208336 RepID=A0ABV0MQH9_9TELE
MSAGGSDGTADKPAALQSKLHHLSPPCGSLSLWLPPPLPKRPQTGAQQPRVTCSHEVLLIQASSCLPGSGSVDQWSSDAFTVQQGEVVGSCGGREPLNQPRKDAGT